MSISFRNQENQGITEIETMKQKLWKIYGS